MVVKKSLYIIFLTVYFFLTVGVSVTAHFCGDELISVAVYTDPDSKEPEGCCEELYSDQCCQDQLTTIKLNDYHKSEAAKSVSNLISTAQIEYSTFDERPDVEIYRLPVVASNSPPGRPVYLINKAFLI